MSERVIKRGYSKANKKTESETVKETLRQRKRKGE